MSCDVLYIIEKFLKHRCLKWARITHLDIWNTSYGQKKGRESNCQFDSRPEKVKNRPDLLSFRQRATYHWKALDESYNFALARTSIGGLLVKLWGSKVVGVLAGAISGLPRERKAIWTWRGAKYIIRGKWWLPPSPGRGVSCVSVLFVAHPNIKMLQLCINHLVWVMCRPVWVSEACQLFLVPSRNSNTPFYPSKCCELRSVPQLFPLPLSCT
jgi:hypothetical protein